MVTVRKHLAFMLLLCRSAENFGGFYLIFIFPVSVEFAFKMWLLKKTLENCGESSLPSSAVVILASALIVLMPVHSSMDACSSNRVWAGSLSSGGNWHLENHAVVKQVDILVQFGKSYLNEPWGWCPTDDMVYCLFSKS